MKRITIDEVLWNRRFERQWERLMGEKMPGSKYLAKKFYLLGLQNMQVAERARCMGCFGTESV